MPTATKKRKRDGSHAASDAVSSVDDGNELLEHADSDGDVPMADPAQNPIATGKKKGLSVNEMRNIKQNAQLFNSNTFHFQIESLLPNVSPKPSHVPHVEKLMHGVHDHLMSLKDISPQHPLEAARMLAKHGIAVPYPLPLPTEDTNWKVGFKRPSDISVVGSWGNKMTVKRQDGAPYGVDIAVEMPADLFQEKDYLNSRFFHKRAFYLAALADSIKSNDALDVEVLYDSADHDARKTCLVLKPRSSSSKLNAVIRIIPTLAPTAPIPAARLSPSNANLRTGEETSQPTPLYNSSLALSRLPKPLLLAIHAWAQSAPAFGDALKLLRVWAAQRGFGAAGSTRAGTVAGFAGRGALWANVLGALIAGEEEAGKGARKRKPVGRGLSSYQLFKAALDFLANRDLGKEPAYMKRSGDAPFDQQLFTAPAFVDPSGTVNLLSGIPQGSLDLLRHEARATLRHLDTAEDPFPSTFLRDCRGLPTRFDLVLSVPLASARPPSSTLLDAGSAHLAILTALPALVSRALGDRAYVVAPLLPAPSFRALSNARPAPPTTLLLGIRLDPTNATRLVDHGPPPESDDAEAFRKLWGSKAETRRFKDGRIVESVVWEGVERSSIPFEIVHHVLRLHFGVATHVVSPTYERVLGRPGGDGWRGVMTAFEGMVKTLKLMDPESGEGVPLSLVSVLPVAEGLRYLSPLPPRAIPIDPESFERLETGERYVEPLDAILVFEQSGRWPDDLAAVQKMKLVFLERIASFLSTHLEGSVSHVALDHDASEREIEDNCSLEVLLQEGYAFRFRIYHNREATLLQRVLERRPPALRGSAPSPKEQEAARKALALHSARFVAATRHHSALAALHHARPTYSATARLLKRWLAAHLLLPHVPVQAVELIATLPFVTLPADQVPGSAGAGFASVLNVFKDWDFALNPLFIPSLAEDGGVKGKFDEEKHKNGLDAFKNMRARDPGMRIAWCLCTEEDAEGVASTTAGPSRLVAERIRAVAKASSKYLEESSDGGAVDLTTLFTHPTDDYDFVLHLDPKVLPRASEFVLAPPSSAKSKGYANQPVVVGADDTSGPMVDFDPAAMFFADLRRVYAGVAEFFFDPLGGCVVGGVWDPSVRKAHNFRVFLGFNSATVPGNVKKPQVTLNEGATLSEMERMGRGIVSRIVRQTRDES
ncbi:Nrap protein [Exidia glandulosa HHB12029]|uniref:U3 small nucleolar RNA-associated protein 22 n=1 Tax=Exidia glandulosa HHB12029 TaxID=1314781 RepID=A0A165GKK2_EXIGL|nr:Nrap protein [Exidia glandulosa HHB12029]